MNQFATAREAKEYLVRRILAQAKQDGVPLSDVERDMLYFSETGWTLPNMMTISQNFDQNHDQDEYERRSVKSSSKSAHRTTATSTTAGTKRCSVSSTKIITYRC